MAEHIAVAAQSLKGHCQSTANWCHLLCHVWQPLLGGRLKAAAASELASVMGKLQNAGGLHIMCHRLGEGAWPQDRPNLTSSLLSPERTKNSAPSRLLPCLLGADALWLPGNITTGV